MEATTVDSTTQSDPEPTDHHDSEMQALRAALESDDRFDTSTVEIEVNEMFDQGSQFSWFTVFVADAPYASPYDPSTTNYSGTFVDDSEFFIKQLWWNAAENNDLDKMRIRTTED